MVVQKTCKPKKNESNMKENEYPQKNRPALVRKRAKFYLKPNISQPSTILEPVFQCDQLQGPDEFFEAYEKFEITIKELRRQRGEDLNEAKIPTVARQRRPEIPRRKVSYQHHVYSSQSQNDASFSQETLQDTFEIPAIHVSQQESATRNCQSKEKEVAGSFSKDEDKVNKLFDDLMSSNIANLDENEAMSYLKDRLNIKPVDINDLQLPNFHDIPNIDLTSSVNNLMKDQSILPRTSVLSDSLKEITLGKQKKLPDKPLNSPSSPTPPRRPLLAISPFEKLSSESIETESNDPFSSHDIDGMDVVTDIQKDADVHGSAEDMVQKVASPIKLNLNVEDIIDNSHLHSVQNVEANIEDASENAVSSSPPEENVEETTLEEFKSNCSQPAQTDDNSVNVFDASQPVQNPDTVPEQQNEENQKESMNYSKKTRASKVDLKKKRHSLTGAGSSWTTGVRRSNRVKRKPLEYWKGERHLYARVHNSLPTVIGVKYLSATDHHGKPGFKDESFVADKYKDLVELISMH